MKTKKIVLVVTALKLSSVKQLLKLRALARCINRLLTELLIVRVRNYRVSTRSSSLIGVSPAAMDRLPGESSSLD